MRCKNTDGDVAVIVVTKSEILSNLWPFVLSKLIG